MSRVKAVLIGVLGTYVASVLYAKLTGGLRVGPSMAGSATPEQIAAWEKVRWQRAFAWPVRQLPGVAIK